MLLLIPLHMFPVSPSWLLLLSASLRYIKTVELCVRYGAQVHNLQYRYIYATYTYSINICRVGASFSIHVLRLFLLAIRL